MTPWLEAEIAVVAWALVDCAETHRKNCPDCAQARFVCERLGDVIEEAIHFVEHRKLVARAEELRRRHLLTALAALERGAA